MATVSKESRPSQFFKSIKLKQKDHCFNPAASALLVLPLPRSFLGGTLSQRFSKLLFTSPQTRRPLSVAFLGGLPFSAAFGSFPAFHGRPRPRQSSAPSRPSTDVPSPTCLLLLPGLPRTSPAVPAFGSFPAFHGRPWPRLPSAPPRPSTDIPDRASLRLLPGLPRTSPAAPAFNSFQAFHGHPRPRQSSAPSRPSTDVPGRACLRPPIAPIRSTPRKLPAASGFPPTTDPSSLSAALWRWVSSIILESWSSTSSKLLRGLRLARRTPKAASNSNVSSSTTFSLSLPFTHLLYFPGKETQAVPTKPVSSAHSSLFPLKPENRAKREGQPSGKALFYPQLSSPPPVASRFRLLPAWDSRGNLGGEGRVP